LTINFLRSAAKFIVGEPKPAIASDDFRQTIIDFLYVDDNKIRVLADQILGEAASDSKSLTTTIAGKRSVGIHAGMETLGGKASFETAHSITEMLAQNTYWKNAKALIEIVRASENAAPTTGSLCHLSGSLMICDLTFFRDLSIDTEDFDPVFKLLDTLGLFKTIEITSTTGKTKTLSTHEVRNIAQSLLSILVQIAKRWPSRVIGVFESDRKLFWFTMDQKSILQEHRDSLLRYRGLVAPGIWHMVSIVDSIPTTTLGTKYVQGQHIADQFLSGNDGLQSVLTEVYKTGGLVFGMRPDMYSAIPVVLYRQLNF
jgi:hypothetical protein